MYSLRLSETSNGRYDAVLSTGELIVSNSKTPTAAACRILADRGIVGQVRVIGDVGSPFTCDIERTAGWSPRSGAAHLIRKWPHLAGAVMSARDEADR